MWDCSSSINSTRCARRAGRLQDMPCGASTPLCGRWPIRGRPQTQVLGGDRGRSEQAGLGHYIRRRQADPSAGERRVQPPAAATSTPMCGCRASSSSNATRAWSRAKCEPMQKCAPVEKARCRFARGAGRAGRRSGRTRARRGCPSRTASSPSRRPGSRCRAASPVRWSVRARPCTEDSSRRNSNTALGISSGCGDEFVARGVVGLEQHHAVRDQVAGRVVAAGHHDEAEAEDVPVAEPLAVDLGGHQRAEQVVARLARGGP